MKKNENNNSRTLKQRREESRFGGRYLGLKNRGVSIRWFGKRNMV
jgi:hypothetical protein